MNSVSDVLGNSGAMIEAPMQDGRVVVVKRLDQAGKTKIEQHLKAMARQQVMEDKADFSDVEFELAYGALLKSVSSADYKFGGKVYTAFLSSGSGGTYITRMLSTWQGGKELTEQDVVNVMANKQDQESLKLALKQAIQESFPKVLAPAQGSGTTGPSSPPAQ